MLEKEAEKERRKARGESMAVDPACYESTDKGRKVNICLCSTDMCNAATTATTAAGTGATKLAFAAMTTVLALSVGDAGGARLSP